MADFQAHVGALPRGATVTGGTISALEALGAGDITVNSVALPAIALAGSVAARVNQLVDAFNASYSLTGVWAEKVDGDNFKLHSSKNIVIAALGGTATLANTGLTAGTTNATRPLLSTVKAFGSGSNALTDDSAVVTLGGQEINMKHARAMGLVGVNAGEVSEFAPVAAPTRTDA